MVWSWSWPPPSCRSPRRGRRTDAGDGQRLQRGKSWRPPNRASGRSPSSTPPLRGGHALLGAKNPLIYGEFEAMAPGVTRTMTAVIPPGAYRLGCAFWEYATVYSSTVTVSGPPVDGAHPYLRVTYGQLAPWLPAIAPRWPPGSPSWPPTPTVSGPWPMPGRSITPTGLADRPSRLRPAERPTTRSGTSTTRSTGAPTGWPKAWTTQLDRFPPLETPCGTTSRRRTWPRRRPLDSDVHQLVARLPRADHLTNDLSLRAHEILENTLQFELTGETDQGSHTGLATALANVQGTKMTLVVIAPLLQQVSRPSWPRPPTDLDQLAALLSTYRSPDGMWTPFESLTREPTPASRWGDRGVFETQSPFPTCSSSRRRRPVHDRSRRLAGRRVIRADRPCGSRPRRPLSRRGFLRPAW